MNAREIEYDEDRQIKAALGALRKFDRCVIQMRRTFQKALGKHRGATFVLRLGRIVSEANVDLLKS